MSLRLLAFVLMFFFSCNRRSTNDIDKSDSVLMIDLLSETGSIIRNLSEIATNVEYLPLETTQNSLIGSNVQKIMRIDERIYIENSGGFGSEIICFDTDGKFLYKLQNRGRGPEEYTSISDFDISSDNKILTILSSSGSKLLVYGISDTGFIFQRSIKLQDPAPGRISMVPETNNTFLAIPPWRGTENTLSLLINAFGDTIHFKPNCYKYKMVRGRNYRALNEMLVYSIGDMSCFMEEFSDTVFCVEAKNNFFEPRMIFNTHGTLFTPEMRGNPGIPYDHTSFIVDIFETPRYVFYSYGSQNTRRNSIPIENIFFDKRTNRKYKLDVEIISETIAGIIVKIPKNTLKDDLTGGPDFNMRIDFWGRYCSGGTIFSYVDVIRFKKYVTGEDFKNTKVMNPKKKDELKKIADSLKETDNPVLVMVTPKE